MNVLGSSGSSNVRLFEQAGYGSIEPDAGLHFARTILGKYNGREVELPYRFNKN